MISQAQGPVGSLGPAAVARGAGASGAGAGAAGAGAGEEPPENMPVMALPATWPTAEPTATPPAVAAIWAIRPGWAGAAGATAAGAGAGTGAGG